MQEQMEAPVFVSRLEDIFRSIIDHAGAKTVFAEPVSVDGKTVIPVAKIRYGFGGGSGQKENREQQGGGGGGGMVAKPVGVVEITQSQTRFIPIRSDWHFLAAFAIGICLGMLAVRDKGRKH
jgi:uncharacterized spore protein YtfJ